MRNKLTKGQSEQLRREIQQDINEAMDLIEAIRPMSLEDYRGMRHIPRTVDAAAVKYNEVRGLNARVEREQARRRTLGL